MLLVEGTRPVGVQGLILGGLEDVSSGGCSLSPASQLRHAKGSFLSRAAARVEQSLRLHGVGTKTTQ